MKINEKEIEIKLEAKKAKTLAEWQELQKEIKKIKSEGETIYSKWKKEDDVNYDNPLFLKYEESDAKLGWLNKIQTEMLYENYFLKHSKGKMEQKNSNGEYWDDKYYYDIKVILGKWYKRCMSGVNEFRLGYEGACDDDIDPNFKDKGISTSTKDFVGSIVYKTIREINEPKIYLHNDGKSYNGVLFRNLHEWRNQKKSNGVNSVKDKSEVDENDPNYQVGFKADVKQGGNFVLDQVPDNVLDEWEDGGYMETINKELGNR